MRSRARSRTSTLLMMIAVPVLAASPSRAGGPLVLDTRGDPVGWSTEAPVAYHVDQAGLGLLTNGEARSLVSELFGNWEAVPTATLAYQDGGPLAVDVDETNFGGFLGPYGGVFSPTGQSPIVFDEDGAIFDAIYGVGTGVLGFAGPTFMSDGETTTWIGSSVPPGSVVIEGMAFLNGKFIDGVDDPAHGNPEIDPSIFEAVFVHEFGHFSGLDHTQIHGQEGPPESDRHVTRPVETMYPFLGTALQSSLERDDQVALSALYPTPGFHASTWRIHGRVLASDGTPFSGVNVIARNIADDADAVSQVSGARLVDPGEFVLEGLTPGQGYRVEIQEIDVFAQGGSSVGPFSPPVVVPGPPEGYNGAAEGPDPKYDLPNFYQPLTAGAGADVFGIDVQLNRQLFRADNESVDHSFYLADAGDFDEDGTLDLVATRLGFDPGNQTLFLRGTGGGSFAAPAVVDDFPGNEPIVVGQFNATLDSWLDFAVGSTTRNEVRIYFGQGDGSFTGPATPVDETNWPEARLLGLTRARMNADDLDDLVTVIQQSDGAANCHVLLSNGTGSFTVASQFLPVGVYPRQPILAGDFAGSETDDIVGLDTVGNALVVLVGDGNGGVSPRVTPLATITTRPLAFLACGDLNQDGRDDVAFSDAHPVGGPGNLTRTFIDILLGDGAGGFGFLERYQVPESFQWGVVMEDFDRDGALDIASMGSKAGTGSPGARATVAFNDGTGGVGEVVTIWGLTEFPNYLLLAADFDGDGWTDLLMNKSGAALLPGVQNSPSILFNRIGEEATGVGDPPDPGRPTLVLHTRPNPMSGETTIFYDLPRRTHVRLRVYDAAGRCVRTVASGLEPAGRRRTIWNGRDERGARVAQGVYFLRLEAEDLVGSRKVVVLR